MIRANQPGWPSMLLRYAMHPATTTEWSPHTTARARLALTAALAIYGALCIVTPDTYRLLDGVGTASPVGPRSCFSTRR